MAIRDIALPVRRAGRALFAAAMLAAASCAAAQESPDATLQRADQIKRTDNAAFQVLLAQLDNQSDRLIPVQRDWLDYLHAWQLGYQGEYPRALSAFGSLIARTKDTTVRARARISLIDDQVNSAHYVDAYANISALLDSLPTLTDRNAHFLALASASYLYNEAGQYDLALRYVDQSLDYDHGDVPTCISLTTKAQILDRSGALHADDPQILHGLELCQRVGEAIYSNIIRMSLARSRMEHGDAAGGLKALADHDAEVQSTHSAALISMFHATLAKAYLAAGDLAKADAYAHSAIDHANQQVNSRASADAWQVLYEAAKRRGDDKGALAFLERSAAADKGYLDDTSARALAFQMVHQQVVEKRAQVAALSQQNQVLKLKQAVDRKNMIAGELGLALLLVVLGSIALYAYRTKRSQIKFMKLARRDGLTDIYNRQYFVEAAEQELAYCQRSARDVSVVVIDLDHFKNINDTHGHAAGDFALKRAVAMCQQHIRSVDVFGRLGGEEFGILMPDCVPERAADLAESMRLSIEHLRNTEDGPEFPVRASFGVSAARWSGYDLRQLLAQADSALYQAKREGRNRVVVFTPASAAITAAAPERRRSTPYTAGEDVRR